MFILLALHLICVNLAGAGPLVLIWFDWKSRRGDALADELACRLARWSVVALLGGSVLGLLVGTAYWSPQYSTAVRLLMPKIKWGLAELVFSLVLMIGVAIWWRHQPQTSRPLRWLRSFLNLLAGTNLLYHFPLLLLLLARLRTGELTSQEVITSARFREWIANSTVLAQAAHFIVASFAVTGATLIAMARMNLRRREANANDERTAIWGARIALAASLLQVPIGVWLVTSLPEPALGQLMGKDPVALVTFVVAIIMTLGLLQHLATTAIGEKEPRNWTRILLLMALTIVAMTFVTTRV